jgi:hypothetical protein
MMSRWGFATIPSALRVALLAPPRAMNHAQAKTVVNIPVRVIGNEAISFEIPHGLGLFVAAQMGK